MKTRIESLRCLVMIIGSGQVSYRKLHLGSNTMQGGIGGKLLSRAFQKPGSGSLVDSSQAVGDLYRYRLVLTHPRSGLDDGSQLVIVTSLHILLDQPFPDIPISGVGLQTLLEKLDQFTHSNLSNNSSTKPLYYT